MRMRKKKITIDGCRGMDTVLEHNIMDTVTKDFVMELDGGILEEIRYLHGGLG